VEAKMKTCQRRKRARLKVAQWKKAVSKDIIAAEIVIAITARERIIDTIRIESEHLGMIGIIRPGVIGILPTRIAAAAYLGLSTAVMPQLKTTKHKW
jgi:hypothetical protein